MNEDLEHRLKRAMARLPIEVAELARRTGLTYQGIKKAFDGKTKNMELETAAAISKVLRCNKNWLASGEGDPEFDGRATASSGSPPSSAHETSPPCGTSAPPVAPAETDVAADGYVRLENLSPEPTMGDGAVLDEPVQVVRHLDVLEQWLRQKVGSANPERIRVLTAKGRSMLPTIQDQDLIFVDVWQREIRDPGIYVIDVAGRLLLKKALIQSTGMLILRSDNVDEYPDEERHDLKKAADTISVAGRVLAWWTLRRG